MGKFSKKIAIVGLLLGFSAISFADDGEIFFNKELQHVDPNVIFLLDTSGSMNFSITGNSGAGNNPNRIDSLKDALTAILSDKSITDIRVGVTSFADYLSFNQGVEDIDGINNENSDKITITKNGSTTIIIQKIINYTNGYEQSTADNSRMRLPPANAGKNADSISSYGNGRLAYRFNNILLNQSDNADSFIKSANLKLFVRSGSNKSITIYVDPAIVPDYLTTTPGFLTKKIREAGTGITCQKSASGTLYDCPVTDIVRSKIKNSAWESGGAISFYVKGNDQLYISNSVNSSAIDVNEKYLPQLVLEVDNSLVTENKKTYRDQMLEKSLSLAAIGGTNTVTAMQAMSNYVSGIAKTSSKVGPYHDTVSQFSSEIPSPIEEGCQLTHVIMMTDGQPQSNLSENTLTAQYMGYSSYTSCQVITGTDKNNNPITQKETYSNNSSEACGRAIASWMANIDQTKNVNGANYIRTHTIGFALGTDARAKAFLDDVARYGQGTSKAAESTDELVQAFKEIIADVRATDSPSASGRVTISAQSTYKQRNEVFYALYASSAYNYWPGNMKRFQLKYIDMELSDKTVAQRPILVDKKGVAAMGTDGAIISTASSFWDNSSSDGGFVDKGGVRGMLKVTNRPQFTFDGINGPSKLLDASNITTTDLGLTGTNAEARKKGLLEFIKGYSYKEGGGSPVPSSSVVLKIADSARSGVTLATYGCNEGNSVKLQECKTLNQTALLASNDGFIRGYDTVTGKVLYEYMPKEMLPLISKLQTSSIVNYDKSRFYGLDGNIVIYHHDTNGNDYMDDGAGTAYAYAVAGRGGPYIYGLDISSPSSLSLAWQITSGESGFSQLGDTWSVPTVGNIKQNGQVIPVLVFGGGYDKKPSDEDPYETRTVSKGNAVYIVNAKTGALIKAITEDMTYSVPSSVTLVTDDTQDKLITDIVFGDTGGQVWRFIVDNGGTNSKVSGGVIAKFGSGGTNSRKFFQKPAIYQYKNGDQKMLSITIGSGFRNHPLSTDIQDKIYSFRLPKANNGAKVLTESDLAISEVDYQAKTEKLNGSPTTGFMINLQAGGEKVITDGLTDFGRLVFNTYVPVPTDKVTCKPRVGLQRTYVYDVMTGKSLLQNAYLESNVSALPADVNTYCNNSYCTIVPSTDILSANKLPAGVDGGDSPLLNSIIPDANPMNYIKTGSTDLFDISSN